MIPATFVSWFAASRPKRARQQWNCGETHCKETASLGRFFLGNWRFNILPFAWVRANDRSYQNQSRHHLRVTAGLLSNTERTAAQPKVNVWFGSTTVVQQTAHRQVFGRSGRWRPAQARSAMNAHQPLLERPLNDPVELRLLSAHGQDPAVEFMFQCFETCRWRIPPFHSAMTWARRLKRLFGIGHRGLPGLRENDAHHRLHRGSRRIREDHHSLGCQKRRSPKPPDGHPSGATPSGIVRRDGVA